MSADRSRARARAKSPWGSRSVNLDPPSASDEQAPGEKTKEGASDARCARQHDLFDGDGNSDRKEPDESPLAEGRELGGRAGARPGGPAPHVRGWELDDGAGSSQASRASDDDPVTRFLGLDLAEILCCSGTHDAPGDSAIAEYTCGFDHSADDNDGGRGGRGGRGRDRDRAPTDDVFVDHQFEHDDDDDSDFGDSAFADGHEYDDESNTMGSACGCGLTTPPPGHDGRPSLLQEAMCTAESGRADRERPRRPVGR